MAGSLAASVSVPQKAEAGVEGLELFAAAPAQADDGFARWKAKVAPEQAEQEAPIPHEPAPSEK